MISLCVKTQVYFLAPMLKNNDIKQNSYFLSEIFTSSYCIVSQLT
jgi:hypothetical protein